MSTRLKQSFPFAQNALHKMTKKKKKKQKKVRAHNSSGYGASHDSALEILKIKSQIKETPLTIRYKRPEASHRLYYYYFLI